MSSCISSNVFKYEDLYFICRYIDQGVDFYSVYRLLDFECHQIDIMKFFW